jgi:hypothetical protein
MQVNHEQLTDIIAGLCLLNAQIKDKLTSSMAARDMRQAQWLLERSTEVERLKAALRSKLASSLKSEIEIC